MFHELIPCAGGCDKVMDGGQTYLGIDGEKITLSAWCCKECNDAREEETRQRMAREYGFAPGSSPAVRPIRPTIVNFETEEEYRAFIEYANSTEKTDTPELNRMRALMKHHIRSKRRVNGNE